MAWNFKTTDVGNIAAVAAVHPDPVAWWTVVQAEASDAEVADLATSVLAAYAGGKRPPLVVAEDLLVELRRVADTEAEMELIRTDEDGTGSAVTYQAKAKGFIG